MVTSASTRPSILFLEFGLTLVTIAAAFAWPRVGASFFAKLESIFGQLARRRALSVLVVGSSACILRLLMLPISPVPQPFINDDFSYLLAADTFSSGRLANPTHPLWVHFESFHITHVPTYMSMYFPGQGMILAAGRILGGHPWYGVLASVGLMCAAFCWMLQGWLPAGWALLGGFLAVLRLGLFSYWIDTYMGGALSAIGGALVLGALPRIRRSWRMRDFFWMALGIAILANSRPYEGLLVSIPAAIAVGWWIIRKPHPPVAVLARRLAPGAAVILCTATFMGYYNYRVFGNVFTPPYQVNRAAYASAPHFLFQKARPEPAYRHDEMRKFYSGLELRSFNQLHTASGFIKANVKKIALAVLFYFGTVMLVPLVMLPMVFRDRRIRLLLLTGGMVSIGLGVETWLIPHYLAPFAAGLYAIWLQCMRHLRAAGRHRPSGLFLAHAIPVLCVLLALVRASAHPLNIQLPEVKLFTAYGTEPVGLSRAQVARELGKLPGKQLAIVRYSPDHDVFEEWVYNAADIDNSKLVWTRDMDPASNAQLIDYFKDRSAWLVEPDFNPPRVSRYPGTEVQEPDGTFTSEYVPTRSGVGEQR